MGFRGCAATVQGARPGCGGGICRHQLFEGDNGLLACWLAGLRHEGRAVAPNPRSSLLLTTATLNTGSWMMSRIVRSAAAFSIPLFLTFGLFGCSPPFPPTAQTQTLPHSTFHT